MWHHYYLVYHRWRGISSESGNLYITLLDDEIFQNTIAKPASTAVPSNIMDDRGEIITVPTGYDTENSSTSNDDDEYKLIET